MKDKLKEKILEICTFHGDEGTSGYLIDEKQVQAIISLIDEEKERVVGQAIGIVNEKVRWAKGADMEEIYDLLRALVTNLEEK